MIIIRRCCTLPPPHTSVAINRYQSLLITATHLRCCTPLPSHAGAAVRLCLHTSMLLRAVARHMPHTATSAAATRLCPHTPQTSLHAATTAHHHKDPSPHAFVAACIHLPTPPHSSAAAHPALTAHHYLLPLPLAVSYHRYRMPPLLKLPLHTSASAAIHRFDGQAVASRYFEASTVPSTVQTSFRCRS